MLAAYSSVQWPRVTASRSLPRAAWKLSVIEIQTTAVITILNPTIFFPNLFFELIDDFSFDLLIHSSASRRDRLA
ncbi:hypothetical protein ACYOEI_05820 [Singulisphaera rosea]